MSNNNSLAQLAAQCEQRAREVQSAGDRAQLLQIAEQLREFEPGIAGGRRKLRLVEDPPIQPL